MLKRLPLILLLLQTFSIAYSQTGSIRGKVLDAKDRTPIDFAVVTLSSPNTPARSTMSEKGGNFVFSNLPLSRYKVQVSFIGYLGNVDSNIVLTAANPSVELKPITLSANAQLLGEVMVVEKKATVEYGADKITFNADQSLLSEGSVATDLLKNVPMVDVDIDGKASIAGKRSTRIFIDGKPSDFMASSMADLLNLLPSDAIEKIEVITSPPAKYAADGDGIINIVLKKGFKIGLNGSLSATGTTLGNYNGSGYLAYRSKKLTLSSNYGYRQNSRTANGTSYRETFTPDTTYYINQFNSNESQNGGQNLRTNMDWDIDERNNLRVSGNLNFNDNQGLSHTDYHYVNEFLVMQSLRKQDNQTNGNSLNGLVDLDYTLKMARNKEEKIAIGFNYNAHAGRNERFLDRSFFLADGIPTGADPTLQHNDNEVGNRGMELSLDYDKPLKGNGNSFELGLKSNWRVNNNEQIAEVYDFDQQTYLISPGLSNIFEFQEALQAAYASLRIRTKSNWGFRAGGRAELTDVAIKTIATRYNLKPYLNFFPNVAINRFFRKRYNVGLTYNMRINRPRENALNPLVENADPVNLSFGNPNLKPAFTHQVDLSFGTFQDKWSLSPRLGFSNTIRIIERIRTIGSDGISRTTYENMASSQAYTFNLSGNYRPTKKINSNAGFTASRIFYDSKNNQGINRDGMSFRTHMGLSMQLPKRTAFEGNVNFYSNSAAQGRDRGSVSTSFSARKSILNNRLNIRISAVDPFYQRNNRVTTEGENFRVESSSVTASSNFSLTLNYRFTKVGKNTLNKQKKDRSGIDES